MRTLVIMAVLLFGISPAVFAGTGDIPVEAAPWVVQIVAKDVPPTNHPSLPPARYPKFDSYAMSNGRKDSPCGDYLMTGYDETIGYKIGPTGKKEAINGLSLAPIQFKSSYSHNGPRADEAAYEVIPGLTTAKLNKDGKLVIPDQYRHGFNLLVTWTVRIEQVNTPALAVNSLLCPKWYGIWKESFPQGDVLTQLFADDVGYGTSAKMTIPEAGEKTVKSKKDPTHTGSCLLTPNDFPGKEFPASMKIEIKWKNDTCQKVQTLSEMRNMIITAIPEGNAAVVTK